MAQRWSENYSRASSRVH